MMIIKNILIVGLLAGFVTAHSLFAQTSFEQPEESQKIDLINEVNEILTALQDKDIFNADTCHDFIEDKTAAAFKLRTADFIPEADSDREMLRKESVNTINKLFEIRLALHQRLVHFHDNGQIKDNADKCLNSIREAHQFIRFAEEYLMEWADIEANRAIFHGDSSYTLVNPQFANDFKLQTGDVLAIRGTSYVSAMIARLGDEESIFSHAAIVGEDKDSGRQYIVEALIPRGLVATELDTWLKETGSKEARISVFRYKQKGGPDNLPADAGKFIYSLINKGSVAYPYDFSMDDSDPSMFFCSEVAQFAYKNASGDNVILPRFRTMATKLGGTHFFKDMEIKINKSEPTVFSPIDIETDPRFELVADFRNVKLLPEARRMDAVLQSVYKWMTNDKSKGRYEFLNSSRHVLLAALGKVARQFGLGAEIMPTHIPFATTVTLAKFNELTNILLNNLEEVEKENKKQGGFSLSFQELMDANDDFRIKDCLLNKEYLDLISRDNSHSYLPPQNKSKFHNFFQGACSR